MLDAEFRLFCSPMDVDRYLEHRTRLARALGLLIELAQASGEPEQTISHLQSLVSGLNEPFLFVVVGEVKAGKSSFLNALFGQEFCKVDVLPATDKIYVFKYGDPERDVPVSESLTERYRKEPFLRDFNIVDTPGTNTIVASHQEITTSFIPSADLVLFVFSVTNPWAASAWEFLRFIGKRWKKNIVFVIQQADLRTPDEITTIRKHLEQTILQVLGSAQPIFAVSAKKALTAKQRGLSPDDPDWKESHFGELEEWITRTVTESDERGGKLRSVAQTAEVMAGDVRQRLQAALDLLKSDRDRLQTMMSSLEIRKGQSIRQIGGFVRELEIAYDECRERGEKLLEEKLTFWQTFKLIFAGSHWEKDFQDEVEKDVKSKVQAQLEHALGLLESDLRSIWQDLQERVANQFDPSTTKQVRGVAPMVLNQRGDILRRLQLTLLEQMSDDRIKQQLQEWFSETARWLRVPAGVAAAGGIVTVIAALAKTAILDVTGTVFGVATLGGTAYAIFRRRQILRAYRTRMDEKRKELAQAVETQLTQAVSTFYHELRQAFAPLESFCLAESQRYEPIKARADAAARDLAVIKAELSKSEG